MSRTALLFVATLAALHVACGLDTMSLGIDAPCTRTSDCQRGLLCSSGICALPEGGAADATSRPLDGNARDASNLDGAPGD